MASSDPTLYWVLNGQTKHLATLLEPLGDGDDSQGVKIRWWESPQYEETVPRSSIKERLDQLPKRERSRPKQVYSADVPGGESFKHLRGVTPEDCRKPAAKKLKTPVQEEDPLVDTDDEEDKKQAQVKVGTQVRKIKAAKPAQVKVGARVRKYFTKEGLKRGYKPGWYYGTITKIQGLLYRIDYDKDTRSRKDWERVNINGLKSFEILSSDDEEDLFMDDEDDDDGDVDLFGEDTEDSNASGIEFAEYNGEPLAFVEPPKLSLAQRKSTVPSNVCLYEKPVFTFHIDTGYEQDFARWHFMDRLAILTTSLDAANSVEKLDTTMEMNGQDHELLLSKMTTNKGKNSKYNRFERTIVKAYYVRAAGLATLSKEMEQIGDFRGMSPGTIASRFELIVSPTARHPHKKYPLQFECKLTDFSLIPENANEGCGSAPETFFEEYLGASLALETVAVQVRIFAPRMGWFKGLLMKKPGISKIQLPPSMKKVEKSCSKKTPKWQVFLAIQHLFPSAPNKDMGRFLHPNKKDPSPSAKRNLLSLNASHMIRNLLELNGVPDFLIDEYSDSSREFELRKHASLVGVADPTDGLPKGTAFITGLGTMIRSSSPHGKVVTMSVLMSRYPCTEKGDLVCIECVMSKPPNMSDENWKFLRSLPFGVIIFAAPEEGIQPTPCRIADGDLDGDIYMCLWDNEIVSQVQNNYGTEADSMVSADVYEGTDEDDDLLGTGFQLDGKPAVVSRKLNAEEYEVECAGETFTMTRAEILQGRDFVEEIQSHKENPCQVLVKWASEEKPRWESLHDLKHEIGPLLAVYAVDHKLTEQKNWKWAAKFKSESEMMEILSHEGTGDDTVVVVYFDDGTKRKLTIKEARPDAEDLLAKYCDEKGLGEEDGWKWVASYKKKIDKRWLERTQEVVSNTRMLREHDRLTKVLHAEYTRSYAKEDFDSMVAFGRAFKKSIDIRKHGGKVQLPLHLHKRITEKNLKPYLSA